MHADYDLHALPTFADLTAEEWDPLAAGIPFLRHAFFRALEVSGCVGPGTAWTPCVLTARRREDRRLVGAVAAWRKTDSFGEFVYDWQWAEVAHRAGLPYYPKLVVTSPFTPASAPRLLVHPSLPADEADRVRRDLGRGLLSLAHQLGTSGVHILFCDERDRAAAPDDAWFVRDAVQYHWHNAGYRDFQDFTNALRSKRRKNVLRERRAVAEAGVRVEAVRGTELDDARLDHLFGFYSATCARYMWGRRYLNRAFFAALRDTMPEAILVFLAHDAQNEAIAGTFSFVSPHRLWGRYWGATSDVPMLHFEMCYYAMIEWAIAEGIEAIEPGAGGEHKIARGFDAVRTRSLHHLLHPGFDRALRQFALREREVVEEEEAEVHAHTSYRRGPAEADEIASPFATPDVPHKMPDVPHKP